MILACSVEYREVKPRSEQMVNQLKKIMQDDATKELIPAKLAGKLGEVLNMPSLNIILAYMLRMDELDDSLQEDLKFILSKSTYLIDFMLEVAK
jgi:hypothetical protein